jgi:signal transduction histidine kinase
MTREQSHFFDLNGMICAMRWLFLSVALLVALVSNQASRSQNLPVIVYLLLGGVAYNLLATLLLYLKIFPDYVIVSTSVLDILLTWGLLFASRSADSILFFFCFLPTISVAIRFDVGWGLLAAAAAVLGYWLSAVAANPALDARAGIFSVGGRALGIVASAAVAGLLGDRLKRSVQSTLANTGRSEQAELRQLRATSERAKAIYELAGTLSATLNYQRVLDSVLEISTIGFEELSVVASRPASMVLLFDDNVLRVAASRNLSHGDEKRIISGQSGIVGRALSTAEPVIAGNLADDPELHKFAAFRRCRSAICVPLRAGFENYGVVVFASPERDAYTDEHVEVLTAICNQAVVAIQNAQLYQTVRDERDRIIEVEEEARNKLARDLHDGPTQSIAAIAMRLNFTRLLLDKEPARAKEELQKLEALARRTTKEIRTMLFTLRPVVLETQGLKVAVEQLVQRLQETEDLPVHLYIEDMGDQLDVNVQAVAFFITEEAVNNVKKHARADNIWVRMYIQGDCFVTEIEDDGKGFVVEVESEAAAQRGSLGLINLRERAELVEGQLTIESQPGRGTKIGLVVPLKGVS